MKKHADEEEEGEGDIDADGLFIPIIANKWCCKIANKWCLKNHTFVDKRCKLRKNPARDLAHQSRQTEERFPHELSSCGMKMMVCARWPSTAVKSNRSHLVQSNSSGAEAHIMRCCCEGTCTQKSSLCSWIVIRPNGVSPFHTTSTHADLFAEEHIVRWTLLASGLDKKDRSGDESHSVFHSFTPMGSSDMLSSVDTFCCSPSSSSPSFLSSSSIWFR